WKDMFVLSSKERVGQYMMITDPKLGKQPIEVNIMYDKTTNQHWFIHKDNYGQYYYLKNETGESDVMNIDHNTNTLTKGHFEKFETQDQIQAKLGVELGRGMATSVFGVAAFGSALPAMTVMGGAPLYSTKASISTRLSMMGGEIVSQIAQGERINLLKIGAAGFFSNPFTSSFVGSSATLDINLNFNLSTSGSDIILGGLLGGVFGSGVNKFSKKFSLDPLMTNGELMATGISHSLVNFWGAFSSTEMQRILNLKIGEKEEKVQESK